MTDTPRIERPTAEQRMAANPHVSAWVGANAGSGKTRVLTQRVARLLLEGADPAKILCLTYTKAAAAEMQTRLFDMLGGWAMQPEDVLSEQLGALEGTGPIHDRARLATARRLFARALETPGGLKIQTIHAFCERLLRRFPLEAGVSPNFDVLEERQSALVISDIRLRMAEAAEAGTSDTFDRIARRLNEGSVQDIIDAGLKHRNGFAEGDLDARLVARFGPVADATSLAIAEERWAVFRRLDHSQLDLLASHGGGTEKKIAAGLQAVLQGHAGDPEDAVETLLGLLLTAKGEPKKQGFPTQKVSNAGGEPFVESLKDWADDTQNILRIRNSIARASDLNAFGTELTTRYSEVKARRGLLDFDDLIERTRALLSSDLGAWVLYKLDQGIDHLLVDEAQDTSPAQWAVIGAITEDFHSGAGARQAGDDVDRSVFVVGDEKQSIYSFQGAEPQAFGATRDRYVERLLGIGKMLERPDLITSFRSAPGILDFVDRVFHGEAATGLTVDGTSIRHVAHRAEDAARIDLWPLIEQEKADDPPEWFRPVDVPPPDHPKTRLATMLAGEIARMVDEDCLPMRKGRAARRVTPGDILVLVRKRDRLARSLIRNLKALGVPVAGADRLDLAEELVVKDVLAVLKTLMLPSDDLNLACVLRSPFCDMSEEALFALAHGRQGTLWAALMTSDAHPREQSILRDLAAKAGFQRPYDLLETLLIAHDGRRRLLARLGPEAEDPLDEVLTEALNYEARETPTLAGFVTWIEAANIKLKREMDKAAGEVRVMTVHGAKGLEAPVVILPDTVSGGSQGGNRQKIFELPEAGNQPAVALWPGSKDDDDPLTADFRAGELARDEAESKRILYVALTRAEDWLILCGAGSAANAKKSWYGTLEASVESMTPDAVPVTGPDGLQGQIRRIATGPTEAGDAPFPEPAPDDRPARPPWLTKAPKEARPKRLSPSRLVLAAAAAEGEGEGGQGLGRAQAMARGSAVHLLLERLPGHPLTSWEELGIHLLSATFPKMDADQQASVLSEALAVGSDPDLAHVFGPDSLGEVPIGIKIDTLATGRMLGRIDRLVLHPDRIETIDFKTDPQVPGQAEEVSPAYLAQQAVYRAALQQIYPGRVVQAAILWTATRRIMALPDALLDNTLARLGPEGIDLPPAAP